MATTPTVALVTEGTGASSTSHTITFTQTTGDRVIIFFGLNDTAQSLSTVGDSFTNLTSTSATFHILTKVLDGSEGGNMVITVGTATKSAWLAYNIQSHAAATAPVFSTVTTGTSTAPNSGSLSPTGGSAKYLWISAFRQNGEEADDDTWCNSAPSTPGTFTGLVQKTTGTSGLASVNGSVAAAQYEAETATVDPGAFDTDQSLAWRAYTVAVYPGASTEAPVNAASATLTGQASSASVKPNAGASSGTLAASWGASYSATILADNPVAYWRLGEPSGPTADNAEGTAARDGTYTGSPTLGASGALTGDADTAVTVGGSAYVSIPYSAPLQLTTITVEAWVKWGSTPSGWQAIAATDSWTAATGWILYYDPSAVYVYFRPANGTGSSFNWSPTLDVWYHIVGQQTGTTGNLYINGSHVVVDSTASGSLATNSQTLYIGSRHANDGSDGPMDTLDATVDEVAVYGSILSSSQVSAHYTAGTTSSGTVGVTANIKPNVGVTTGTATAQQPTVTTSAGGTNAPAELASATLTAQVASAKVNVNTIAAATGTATGQQPVGKVGPSLSASIGTATAQQAAGKVGPSVPAATGTGTAQQPAGKVAPVLAVASATLTGQQAAGKVSPSLSASAATATAQQPGATVYVYVAVASGSLTSQQASASTATATNAPVGLASAILSIGGDSWAQSGWIQADMAQAGSGYGASANVKPNAGITAGTLTAQQPSASTSGNTNAAVDLVSAALTAQASSAKVAPVLAIASATLTAQQAAGKVSPSLSASTGTATAQVASAKVSPVIAASTGTLVAPDATANTSGATNAPVTAATATTTAQAASAKVEPVVSASAGTLTAQVVSVTTSAATNVAVSLVAATLTAQQPAGKVSPSLSSVAATLVAGVAAGKVAPNVGTGVGTLTSQQPFFSSSSNAGAFANAASGVLTANAARIGSTGGDPPKSNAKGHRPHGAGQHLIPVGTGSRVVPDSSASGPVPVGTASSDTPET